MSWVTYSSQTLGNLAQWVDVKNIRRGHARELPREAGKDAFTRLVTHS